MFDWHNDESAAMLSRGYLLNGENVVSATKRIAQAAAKYGNDPSLESRVFDLIAKGWLVPASPIWANMGTERGLPISCFGSYIDDSMDGILSTLAEVGMMTKIGGGTSAYFGAIRRNGADIKMNGKSNGPVPFMQLYDTAMRVVSQGSTRRGSFAAYLPVEHPDILEFLKIKDIGFYIQDLSFGVTVTDDWMNEMIAGDPKKRDVWTAVLHSRKEKGYPYILFTDTVNRMKPECYKDRPIYASNLCSEIMLPSSNEESFVCCISAMNAEKYYEWKDTDAVEVAIRFLDAVMEEFIQKAKSINHMQRAVRFAENHRAVGLGLCGWHSLLQSKGYPFNSLASFSLTHSLMGTIREQAEKASMMLRVEKGAPLGFPDLDRRNTTLMAIAPNTSSSSITGQISAGIEPFESNYYVKDLAKGSFTRKNKYLEGILEERGLNNDDTWRNIHKSGGSVLGIPEIKDVHQVFLTFGEINQFELLRQAGLRQQFIDQGQSLNIHVPPGTDLKTINKLHIAAWQAGVKALYYQRSRSASQGFSLQEVCSMCAG
jgi:ribonucleoside-diphosphate reductase alpha chain